MIRKLCKTLFILPVLFFTTAQSAGSVEFVISDNGDSSTNEVTVQNTSNTTVNQTNTATVNNTIDANANTGNNSASNNSGDTAITTGDTTIDIEAQNIVNQSTVSSGCCNGEMSTISVSGNGSNSENTVQATDITATTVTINQRASVTNSVNGSANTGKNNASDNSGNVTIITGKIKHAEVIWNKNINVAVADIKDPKNEYNVSIKNNGTDSENTVLLTLTNDIITSIYNSADLYNLSFWDFNTGKNKANNNNGDVVLVSGNIYSATSIKNDGVNIGGVTIDCCDKEDEKITPPPTPTPPQDPPTPPGANGDKVSNGNGSSGIGGPGGNGVGDVLGAILPATGASFWLFATIANIIMFLLGLYLRLKAGRSPCYAYVER